MLNYNLSHLQTVQVSRHTVQGGPKKPDLFEYW